MNFTVQGSNSVKKNFILEAKTKLEDSLFAQLQ